MKKNVDEKKCERKKKRLSRILRLFAHVNIKNSRSLISSNIFDNEIVEKKNDNCRILEFKQTSDLCVFITNVELENYVKFKHDETQENDC